MKVGGSIRGGTGAMSGRIAAAGGMGFVTIAGSLIGGSNTDAGSIRADVRCSGVKVGGSVTGAELASGSAAGSAPSATWGPVSIRGDLTGGPGGLWDGGRRREAGRGDGRRDR